MLDLIAILIPTSSIVSTRLQTTLCSAVTGRLGMTRKRYHTEAHGMMLITHPFSVDALQRLVAGFRAN